MDGISREHFNGLSRVNLPWGEIREPTLPPPTTPTPTTPLAPTPSPTPVPSVEWAAWTDDSYPVVYGAKQVVLKIIVELTEGSRMIKIQAGSDYLFDPQDDCAVALDEKDGEGKYSLLPVTSCTANTEKGYVATFEIAQLTSRAKYLVGIRVNVPKVRRVPHSFPFYIMGGVSKDHSFGLSRVYLPWGEIRQPTPPPTLPPPTNAPTNGPATPAAPSPTPGSPVTPVEWAEWSSDSFPVRAGGKKVVLKIAMDLPEGPARTVKVHVGSDYRFDPVENCAVVLDEADREGKYSILPVTRCTANIENGYIARIEIAEIISRSKFVVGVPVNVPAVARKNPSKFYVEDGVSRVSLPLGEISV
eukprot:Filipodium_phascolosomae@DN2676_c1_g1_i13.p1